MPEIGIELAVVLLSALTGTLLPLTKAIVQQLRKRQAVERFFSSRTGQWMLAVLGLGLTAETPKQLFTELTQASQKLDGVVAKIQAYAKVRESAVGELEAKLEKLSAQEGQLRQTIEQLERVPLPAAEHFVDLLKKEEKGSAYRDYALFVAGVVVSAIVAVVLKHFGIG